jgi:O-antigen/teichoic acid export membrane protein
MSAATQRFITFELGKKDFEKLRKIFSTSITIHVLIAFIVLFFSETIGLWFLNYKLNIPVHRMAAANWVYQFSIFVFILNVINVPYDATIIAYERMNVYAYIGIIEVVLKLIIVFILLWFGFDKLIFYAILVFIVSFIIRIIYIVYCRLNFKECKFHFLWDKQLFKSMASFANWNLLGVFSGLAYNQGVNILLNLFFGPSINAARGIAYQVQGAVNGFVTNFQVAVNPQIIKSYAISDKEYMYSLIFRSSKYSFYLLLILSLPVLIQTEFILKIWLKIVPDYAIIFTKLILIDILIGSLSGPLQTMVQATGKIKKYQIIVSGILILNLPISYLLLSLGKTPQITFVVSIIITIIALLARLIILNIDENFPISNFIKTVLFKVIMVFIASALLGVFVSSKIIIITPFKFVLLLPFLIFITLINIFVLGMNKSERIFVKRYVLNFIKNK